MQSIWGKRYRLERGKGYGEARWWVLTKDGHTEVAGGLLYDEAKRIFDSCESAPTEILPPRASLDPNIINFEDEVRRERRARRAVYL
jgi:hypothetical protein